MSLAQLVRLRRLGWAGHVVAYAMMNSLSMKSCFHEYIDRERRGRHRTLVADLADDVSHICSFAGRDASQLATRQQGRVQSQLLIIRRTSW